jgi:predicted RND superfamily exporter protein
MSKRIDQLALALADFVIRFRWFTILFALLLVGLAGSGARHLAFANNYRTFFSSENPELIAFETFQDTYTKNDNILFVVQPAEGSVFSPRIAGAIERLTEEAWQLPYVTRVDSISNFQHSWADGDELTVEDLIRDGATLTEASLAKKQAVALAEPLLRDSLISDDADTTGINVTLHYPEESLKEVPETVAVARQLVIDVQAEYPDLTIVLTGLSMLNNAFTESGQKDAMTLVPIMYAILIL